MEIYRVSFFGHRYIDDFNIASKMVEDIIYSLIQKHEYVEFMVGRDGDFDQIATSAIKQVQKNYAENRCDITWVMPYLKAEYSNNAESFDKYYDYVIVCSKSNKVYPKQAIQVRNRYMVDHSDLVVFWVERLTGGAYQTMEYAKSQRKETINLSINIYTGEE